MAGLVLHHLVHLELLAFLWLAKSLLGIGNVDILLRRVSTWQPTAKAFCRYNKWYLHTLCAEKKCGQPDESNMAANTCGNNFVYHIVIDRPRMKDLA